MKISTVVLSVICLSQCLTFASCDGLGCGNYSFLYDNTLFFHVLDKHSKKDLLLIGQTQYAYDSVKVLNADKSPVWRMEVGYDGLVLFNYLTSGDQGKVNQIISRRFLMHFNNSDTDTIDINFSTTYNNCHYQVLKSIKIAYNDSVYYDRPSVHDGAPSMLFLK